MTIIVFGKNKADWFPCKAWGTTLSSDFPEIYTQYQNGISKLALRVLLRNTLATDAIRYILDAYINYETTLYYY